MTQRHLRASSWAGMIAVVLALPLSLSSSGMLPIGSAPAAAVESNEAARGYPPVASAEAVAIAVGGTATAADDAAEIGANDFRISDMGNADGVNTFDARAVAIAYNSTDNHYLVVWWGNDETGSLDPGEFEIFGQLINAATGNQIGANDFRISQMGGDGANGLDANTGPSVAYNSTNNQYLVVWPGDNVLAGASEIYGQRVSNTGALVGVNFRISDMGADDNNTNPRAFDPDVAYNSTNNQYLVVWRGDDGTAPLVDNENEIWGQLVTATGTETGTNDFRISDLGPDGDAAFFAQEPRVAYNSTDNQYLVVWQGDDDTAPLVDDESEIFGQRLTAAGAQTGANDFRISDMGPDGDPNYDAFGDLDVAYNNTNNEYLVVWRGDDNTGGLINGEGEIFGQRLSNLGAEVGTNDFRISDVGGTGNTTHQADEPALTYIPAGNRYLVVWRADEIDGDLEVYGQLLTADGSEFGTNDFRISDIDGTGTSNRGADPPRVAYASALGHALVVFAADDPDSAPLDDNEFEIFGQRLAVGTLDFFIGDAAPRTAEGRLPWPSIPSLVEGMIARLRRSAPSRVRLGG